MPVFNSEKFLSDTIQSILKQTLNSWELLLIDDNSFDSSLAICRSFEKRDSRIKCFVRSREPKGANTCRNIGFKLAKSKYVVFMDSDDFMEPFCLKQRVDFMESNPLLDFSVWNQQGVFSSQREGLWCDLREEDDLRARILMKSWQTSAPIYKADSIRLIKWRENALAWQDWDFAIQVLLIGLLYKKVIDSLPDIRINRLHRDGISSTNRSFHRVSNILNTIACNEERLIGLEMMRYLEYLKLSSFSLVQMAALELNNKDFQIVLSQFKNLQTFGFISSRRLIVLYLCFLNLVRRIKYLRGGSYRVFNNLLKEYIL